MARGKLRIYLGSAPGVGKTFAMLGEGYRRKERGHDVVVGYVETHEREHTKEQLRDMEVIPRKHVSYRGTDREEMDLDAILARKPETVLIDEMAHTNIPGSKNAKRWEDIFECIDAGINVVATLNIQHLESLNDVIAKITGVTQRETVPDLVVRSADQIELVDMSPEALRRRMAHGNIYKSEKIDAALSNFFREHNLGALRELALLWVADRVDDALKTYRRQYDVTDRWETRERVVVALKGRTGEEMLIRRAARLAERSHGELIAVHFIHEDGVSQSNVEIIQEYQDLTKELGGRFEQISSTHLSHSLVAFAESVNATQLVLGASQRSRIANVISPSIINDVVAASGHIDVHVVSHDDSHSHTGSVIGRIIRQATSFRSARVISAFTMAAISLSIMTPILAAHRDSFDYSTLVLLYLFVTVVVSMIGGIVSASLCAVGSSMIINYYFTPPIHRWTIDQGQHIFALVVFVSVGAVISGLVDIASHQREQARKAREEAQSLARFAAAMAGTDPLSELLAIVCTTFNVNSAALLDSSHKRSYTIIANAGEKRIEKVEPSDVVEDINKNLILVLRGQSLSGEARKVLHAFSSQLRLTIEARQNAKDARQLGQANDLRAALLQAVSHDLRTPLASIKASVSSLRQPDVEFSHDDESEFLATIEEETDRLNELVGNLLDMSRVQTQSVVVNIRSVGVDEVISSALASLGPRAHDVDVSIDDNVPSVNADPVLLERSVANVIDNAVKWNPTNQRVHINAGTVGNDVDIRVIDHGPGIRSDERDRVFEPFQRVTDRSNDTGVGLGLAVAKGFVEAMNGSIVIDETPGGGATMIVRVPHV